jgi:catalase
MARSKSRRQELTTSTGAPVPQDDVSRTIGPRGPLATDNVQLFEKLAHFNRERIPERVVHARGTGAYGTFTLTKDLSRWTAAEFLRGQGTRTEVFARLSTVGGGQDSSDYARDPRGFALKFYTSRGNWDMVGNNTPVFFLRDPIKFPDFVHSQKKNPRTNLPDPAAMYEFWANSPQSLHEVTILMSDRGIPASLRHMHGFSSHTLSLWNARGERFWVKWHFKTDQGIRCLTEVEAAARPANGAQRDLVEAIDRREFPSWTVKLQVMPEAEAAGYRLDAFDLTKVWPYADYPLIEIGRLQLNRNVENYFAEVEQSAFSPSHLVPGVGVSPDRMLQARLLAYPDAHRYRLGANANSIPVNAPRAPVHTYQRDGAFAGLKADFQPDANAGSGVNFWPNDRGATGAPAPADVPQEPPLRVAAGDLAAHDRRDEDNFSQAGALFRLMSPALQRQLCATIAGGLVHAESSVRERMLAQFRAADGKYGAGVLEALRKAK